MVRVELRVSRILLLMMVHVCTARRLSDRRPEEREAMKGPFERGIEQGALGGVRVPGGIPGFFLSVPPWPAPTPMPMDQATGWAAYPPIPSYSMPQVSPYAAFLPQPLSQVPYPMIYGPGGEDGSQHGLLPPQGNCRGAAWPEYPRQTDAADVRGSSFIGMRMVPIVHYCRLDTAATASVNVLI